MPSLKKWWAWFPYLTVLFGWFFFVIVYWVLLIVLALNEFLVFSGEDPSATLRQERVFLLIASLGSLVPIVHFFNRARDEHDRIVSCLKIRKCFLCGCPTVYAEGDLETCTKCGWKMGL